jgi:putative hydrolase of the HAD superfamily
MKYKAVIFDLFGTLVDCYDLVGYHSALRETSSILKIQHNDFIKLWKDTDTKRATGVFKTLEENLEYICRELNVPVKKFDINLAKMVRYDYISLCLAPRRYAIETLSQIKEDGYKIGLISNCSTETPAIWPHTPFAPFFDAAVFSSVAGLQKPDPAIYKLAAAQLQVEPSDCLYVGDGDDHELTGAAAAGMHPVLISVPVEEGADPIMRSEDKVDDYACPVIPSLPEVLDILAE